MPTKYATYNTSNKEWLIAMFRLVEKLHRVYYPGSPSSKVITSGDTEFGVCLSFSGWRTSKYNFTLLEVEIFPRSITFIEVDNSGKPSVYSITNSTMYAGILDTYDHITTLVINNTKEYN